MILTLCIEKISPAFYQMHYEARGVEVREPSEHGSISEALAACGNDMPEDFAQFVEVQYGGVNSGTTEISRLRDEPEQLADELVALVAKVSETCEVQHRQETDKINAPTIC